jgi:hypothetical protein
MKEFFEYFFYRMYKRDNSTQNSALALTGTQFIFLMNLNILILEGPLNIKGKTTNFEIIVAGILFFGLLFFNLNFYSKKLEELERKWENEATKEKRIGMLKIVLFVIVSWGFIFINGLIYNRYK